MTPWQESCITALASSSLAFEAFKMKQKNRKLLDQYLCRIWKTWQINESKPKVKLKEVHSNHVLKPFLEEWRRTIDSLELVKVSKNKVKKMSLNVGIEIEHDAIEPTNLYIQKRILQQNCTSFDSGYDGDCENRLRENRIRLNRYKGLKGLYTLLQYMQENDTLAYNSSVHMHIDAKSDKSFNIIYDIYTDLPVSYDKSYCFKSNYPIVYVSQKYKEGRSVRYDAYFIEKPWFESKWDNNFSLKK